MPVTDRDIEAWAARIRPHFEPPLQDVAEVLAGVFAPAVGSRIKNLRPGTPMAEVVEWLKEAKKEGSASLDWVEVLMAAELEASSQSTDAFAENIEQRTFKEYVQHLCAQRRTV